MTIARYLKQVKIFQKIFLSTLFIAIIGIQATSAQDKDPCILAHHLYKTAQKYHYAPRPLDDSLSKFVYDQLLDWLDPYELIFTSDDQAVLSVYQYQLDESIKEQSCEFLDQITNVYQKRMEMADSLLQSWVQEKPDFSKSEVIHFSSEKEKIQIKSFSARWRKWMKLRTLSASLSDTSAIEKRTAPDYLQELYQSALQSEVCRLQAKLNFSGGLRKYIGYRMMKALAFAYDPHTVYLQPEEKSQFEDAISKDALSFGFEITRNLLGEIEIFQIIPGGPAWDSNLLHEGDVILEASSGKGLVKDFSCLASEEVFKFIYSPSINEAVFRIRKSSGKEIQVNLEKKKIDVEENVIKSFILKGDRKIAYIKLPSFYAPWRPEEYFSKGCSNDVAKELIRLKREGIEALVFDLRDNGGGSVMEAIRLAGIFINFGALGIMQQRDEVPETLKDLDRGIIYEDPIVLLVNKQSASASEIFASALQDHNRALIVGSPTYGKASEQEIIPLNAHAYGKDDLRDTGAFGYVKLTLSQFFRVTGESNQK
ncbi:MAG: S41 family peptidase, partial [Bacteroidota bacterium]